MFRGGLLAAVVLAAGAMPAAAEAVPMLTARAVPTSSLFETGTTLSYELRMRAGSTPERFTLDIAPPAWPSGAGAGQ